MGTYDLPHASPPREPKRRSFLSVNALLGLAAAYTAVFVLYPAYRFYGHGDELNLTTVQKQQFNADLARCQEFQKPPFWEVQKTTPGNRINPRYRVTENDKITVLQNATVFDGERWIGSVDLVIEQGTIREIDHNIAKHRGQDVEVIDVQGKIVTPGLVDVHSHSGVAPFPALRGSDDTNEGTQILTPFARTLDAIHVYDPAHALIASGGVTTSLVLPGSANILGGEAFAIKNAVPADSLVESMLVEPSTGVNRTRWMKMACGENPKRSHPAQASTRMGLSWKLREHLSQAKDAMKTQDAWCARATSKDKKIRHKAALEGLSIANEKYWEFTTAMLRGQVHVNTHCYETVDIETMIRHTHEFGFRVSAFHHALSAWKVAGLLSSQGYPITQAIFAELGLYKKEGYDANFYAGKILHEAGVPVVYKSDHPVTNAKYLLQQPQAAYQYGLPEDVALKSITSTAARTLALDDRIGYVREGYDADLVVWDSHPLSTGATPLQVFIDGKPTLNSTEVVANLPSGGAHFSYELPSANSNMTGKSLGKEGLTIIHGIKSSYIPSQEITASESLTLVTNGTHVLCLAATCEPPAARTIVKEITLEHGTLTPPVYAVSNALGLSEIEQEQITRDGPAPTDPNTISKAHFGLHFGSDLLQRAQFGGVTKIITPPNPSGGIVRGVSAGFYSAGASALDGIWQENVALHVVIGQSAKKAGDSISRQIEILNSVIINNNGTLPVVVHADNKDDIAQIILLSRQHPRTKFTIFNAAESYLLAHELAEAGISVILGPWRCAPHNWEGRRCLAGPPMTKSPVKILVDAGVNTGIAIGTTDDDLTVQLPREAVWAGKYAGLGEAEGWRLVSGNVKKALGLEGEKDEMVVWEGVPGKGGSMVGVAGVKA
ncbi:Similar to Dihydropyrimidinase; acc. no. Q55DL0 [Pyronema omphalodes CBS 100304]|uniref:Similar to Dihydropyrimidinase acc. no. Q55DL0 n=1 Tax=Pyronema omphalodes (strain CBS 100304) TaxID=1076935 RepID=U4LQ97_PYROM|nr:Similar to Dihydropyrimidinase; acc. no. Q55DL0 [Pyronema omphalodes CBS 100304]